MYRIIDKKTGKLKADLIALAEETYDASKDLEIFHPIDTWKRSTLAGCSYEIHEILVPIFKKGQCIYESPKTMDIRNYCNTQLSLLWDETRRLVNPQEVYVDLSKPLYDLKMNLLNKRGN